MNKIDKSFAEHECLLHVKKPDVDNLIKYYLDCMNGICYLDDSQVSIAHAIKLYSPTPRTEIILEEKCRLMQIPSEAFCVHSESDKQECDSTDAIAL
jgi:hypothetical protein